MKKARVISIGLTAAMLITCSAGCKKQETNVAPIPYYGEQSAGEETAVTLQNSEQTVQVQSTEALAPILADREQQQIAAADPEEGAETEATIPTTPTLETTQTTQPTETSETTAPSETTVPSETTAAAAPTQQPANDTPSMSSGSHIQDNAGVIADEASVNSAMSSFESSTGVSPAIFTIRDSLSGDDFRQYARDLYSNNFSDQDHVVIVYQLNSEGCWSWTWVFGSNTGTVFPQDKIDTLQSGLTSAFSSGNVDSALVTTFNNAAS